MSGNTGANVLNDEQLVEKIQAGDQGAFEVLLQRYDRQVLGLALRFTGNSEDARDIYQDVFVRVYKSLPKFEFRSSFRTWLFRVATNVCLTHQARSRKLKLVSMDEAEGEEAGRFGPVLAAGTSERSLLRRELSGLLSDAVGQLSPRQRLVFEMRHYQGYKLAEIATLLNCAEGTVKRHLFTATRRMRERLSSTEAWGETYAAT